MNSHCINCNKDWGKPYKIRRFCGRSCEYEYRRKTYKAKNPISSEWNPQVNSGTIGATHELLACVDLMKKGHHVYRAVSPSVSCDLLVIVNKRLIRLEVTTGIYDDNGKIKWNPKKDWDNFDVLAVVTRDGLIHYIPEFEALTEDNPKLVE